MPGLVCLHLVKKPNGSEPPASRDNIAPPIVASRREHNFKPFLHVCAGNDFFPPPPADLKYRIRITSDQIDDGEPGQSHGFDQVSLSLNYASLNCPIGDDLPIRRHDNVGYSVNGICQTLPLTLE